MTASEETPQSEAAAGGEPGAAAVPDVEYSQSAGLSKPRYKRFEGLPLDQRLRDADSGRVAQDASAQRAAEAQAGQIRPASQPDQQTQPSSDRTSSDRAPQRSGSRTTGAATSPKTTRVQS